MLQPITVAGRRRRMTMLEATELNGGLLAPHDEADFEAAAVARAAEAPETAEAPEASGSAEAVEAVEAPVAAPVTPVRRRGPTTMAVVEANGGSLGASEEAIIALRPDPEPVASAVSAADTEAAPEKPRETFNIPMLPTTDDGLPIIPHDAELRMARGRGEIIEEPAAEASTNPYAPSADEYGDGRVKEEHEGEAAEDEKDEFEPYDTVDALHDEIMRILLAPRMSLRDAISQEMAELRHRRAEIAGQMDAVLHNHAGGDHDERARPGLLAGIVHGLAAAVRGNPLRPLTAQAVDLDRAIAQRRWFRQRILGGQYRQMTDAADQMYRAFARLDAEIKRFNGRVTTSQAGSAFLSDLDHVADTNGVTVDALRARIANPDDQDADIMRLRKSQEALLATPEIKENWKRMEAAAAAMARHGDALRQNLDMLHRNGVDLTGVEGLADKLEQGMKVEKPLVGDLDAEGKDKFAATLKKLTESVRATIEGIVRSIGNALGFGRAP